MQLYIGNKNYSSWSMRPWVLMRQAGIAFDERQVYFDDFKPASPFHRAMQAVSPAARVPVLVDDGFAVWDSLAICEYLAERFPQAALWPADVRQRARARSVCAEMHAGFGALRRGLPMNIELQRPEIGPRLLREDVALRADVERILSMWAELLSAHGGPMLFGAFGIADAYFAPVVMRFRSYAVPLPAPVAAYTERVTALPAVQAWVAGALAERRFVAEDEPYRTARD